MTRSGSELPTAVVTGASSGIGRAIAARLASAYARVCLLGRDPERLKVVAEEVISCGEGQPVVYPVDLTVDEEVESFAARCRAELDGLHALVHSAGIIVPGSLGQATVAALDWQYRVNLRGPFVLTQALLPMLIDTRGQLVFINSTTGVTARAGAGLYAATKHGLRALADSLREELNPLGVRVLSIYPGRTATPMQAAVHAIEGREYRPERLVQPADVAELVLQALAMPRTAEVTDIHVRPRVLG